MSTITCPHCGATLDTEGIDLSEVTEAQCPVCCKTIQFARSARPARAPMPRFRRIELIASVSLLVLAIILLCVNMSCENGGIGKHIAGMRMFDGCTGRTEAKRREKDVDERWKAYNEHAMLRMSYIRRATVLLRNGAARPGDILRIRLAVETLRKSDMWVPPTGRWDFELLQRASTAKAALEMRGVPNDDKRLQKALEDERRAREAIRMFADKELAKAAGTIAMLEKAPGIIRRLRVATSALRDEALENRRHVRDALIRAESIRTDRHPVVFNGRTYEPTERQLLVNAVDDAREDLKNTENDIHGNAWDDSLKKLQDSIREAKATLDSFRGGRDSPNYRNMQEVLKDTEREISMCKGEYLARKNLR